MSGQFGRDGDAYWLTGAEIEQYRNSGYVTLRDVVSESEIAALEPMFDSFIRGEVAGMERDFCDMSGPADRRFEDFSLVNAMLPRRYRPALQDNVYERRCAAIARQLIGEDATLDYDQFLAKRPAKPDAQFSWHQDLGYWPTGCDVQRTATCSLALDDADSENGCLRVVPGTHRGPLRPHRPLLGKDGGGPATFEILTVVLDPNEAVIELPLRRGDITVHNELIVHGSGGNRSPTRWRRTYIAAFRAKACVDFERSVGFTHSHNDKIEWQTHLGALTLG